MHVLLKPGQGDSSSCQKKMQYETGTLYPKLTFCTN